MGKTIDIGGRIHNPEVGNVVTGANEILDDTKNKKQDVINGEVDAALEALDANKQDNLTFDQTPTESSTNPVTSGGVYAADLALQQAIEAILTLIPSAASALNQLADKSFVNSSIATASATFRGTYNLVSELHLSVTASHQDIATALASAVSTADNNDYCFVQIPTSDTSSDIRVTERYKFNGTAWQYEYDLNNSGFTAQQWEAINSGITALLVTKLGALPTAAELAISLAGKQNVLTFDNVPVSGSDNPVKSGGLYQLFTAIDAKFPSDASSSNKLVAENRLAAYVTAVIEALDASFDLTSADGHVTFRMTQTNGVIASVQILTSDIASASALTTLGGRVSTNETDIANLQAAYAGLTQSDVIVGTLPSSGQQQNKIYRQPDQDHTPPQFYSDYMWNGSTWVLMATYNNAIDAIPTAGSHNLVESGGIVEIYGEYIENGVYIHVITDKDKKILEVIDKEGNKVFTGNVKTLGNLETNTSYLQKIVSEEWLFVITDNRKRVLFGIRKNGYVDWWAGVPKPIRDYIEKFFTRIDNLIIKTLYDVLSTKLPVITNTPLEYIRFDVGSCPIFRNWGVIGASRDSGEFYGYEVGAQSATPEDVYEYSRLQQIVRLCGAEGYNFSIGGQTAKGWLEDMSSQRGLGFASLPENFKQVYIIDIGGNDKAQIEGGTLIAGNAATDIDLNNYENNANTFAGYYGKIIQKMKELVPDAYFFCETQPYNSDYEVVNTIIRDVVALFDRVYLLDFYTYNPFSRTSDFQNLNGHGSALGYLYNAYEELNYIDWHIRKHYQDFRGASLVGTGKRAYRNYKVFGTVVDGNNNPISGVLVSMVNGKDCNYTRTDSNGQYEISGLTNKTYVITIHKSDYTDQTDNITINSANEEKNIVL